MSAAYRPGPELRIGDAEREAAVAALSEHYTAGRITREEFDERSSLAFAARTSSQLWPLFTDLPPLRPGRETPERGPQVAQLHSQVGRGRRSWGFGAGMAPVLLVLLALVVLTNLPWPILLLVGFLVWSRTMHHWRHRQTRGNRRAVRGTCS